MAILGVVCLFVGGGAAVVVVGDSNFSRCWQ